MNDDTNHESELLPFQRTDAYRVAKALALAVHAARVRDAELRDQASRAAKSAFLQTAEGLPNKSVAMRRRYFVCARNSACETAAALDLALAMGCCTGDAQHAVQELAGKLSAILTGLMRG